MIRTHENEMVEIGKLVPADYNPRVMAEPEVLRLMASITEFGVVEPVAIRKEDRLVIGGHQRIEAISRVLAAKGLTKKQIASTKIPVLVVEGLDDAKAKALNLALNKIHGEWDFPKLGELLKELSVEIPESIELTGFTAAELDDIITMTVGDLRGGGVGDDGDDEDEGKKLDEDIARTKRVFSFEATTDAEAAEVRAALELHKGSWMSVVQAAVAHPPAESTKPAAKLTKKKSIKKKPKKK